MRTSPIYFPADLLRIKKNVRLVFRDHSRKIEEQVNFIQKQEDYLAHLENKLETLKKEVETVRKAEQERADNERMAVYLAQEKRLDQISESILAKSLNIPASAMSFGPISVEMPCPETQVEVKAEQQIKKSSPPNKPKKRDYG